MKVAKADQRDLDAAMMLIAMLDTVSGGYYPSDSNDAEDDPLFFDSEDPEHLAQLWKRLKTCLDASPGFQGRVIFGAATLMDPRNEVIDPDDDCLALHPKLTAAMKDSARYRWLRTYRPGLLLDMLTGPSAPNDQWADELDAVIDSEMAAAMPANATSHRGAACGASGGLPGCASKG